MGLAALGALVGLAAAGAFLAVVAFWVFLTSLAALKEKMQEFYKAGLFYYKSIFFMVYWRLEIIHFWLHKS